MRKSSIFLALIVVGLEHVLLHGIHHKLIEHFWEVWLLAVACASTWHTCVLDIVARNSLSLIGLESTLLNVIGSLGTNHVPIYFFVVELLWTYRIRQVDFLNLIVWLLFGHVVCLSQLFDLFHSLDNLGLHLHKYNLFAIGRQSIILFAQLQKTWAIGFLHLCEVRRLIVSFVIGSVFESYDHPALETDSWLHVSNHGSIYSSQVLEKCQQLVKLSIINLNDGPCRLSN